jgi:hypothetical protein
MNRLRPFSDGKRAKRTLGKGRNGHLTKAGPGRVASHKRRPAGTKIARMLARAR